MSQPEQHVNEVIETREGVVGVFDILGFQGYLRNVPCALLARLQFRESEQPV